MDEFELIRRYFTRSANKVSLGIGDDCALLSPRSGYELAVSTDMLVAGRHFFPDTDPEALGWKTLAVNLSDLAAMGAEPLAFTLALALPEANEDWLEKFSRGLFTCAEAHNCDLIGGDTTRGPLNLCVTIFGEVPQGRAILRSGARISDEVWVSGTLGDAALGLRMLQGFTVIDKATDCAAALHALQRPTPRIALGMALRGIATAMLDISDGLLGDLDHILSASEVGVVIQVDALPLSAYLTTQAEALRLQCTLAGGDDYELCFTAPASMHTQVELAARQSGIKVTHIGHITAVSTLALVNDNGAPYALPADLELKAYNHFAR